ncbi:MAG TPA: hypothetical protein VKM72_28690 [Thermoanaerobaculia bacterium]|nr:hypothetical protein [Thermoanaerobaculia bacterium]
MDTFVKAIVASGLPPKLVEKEKELRKNQLTGIEGSGEARS